MKRKKKERGWVGFIEDVVLWRCCYRSSGGSGGSGGSIIVLIPTNTPATNQPRSVFSLSFVCGATMAQCTMRGKRLRLTGGAQRVIGQLLLMMERGEKEYSFFDV